MKGKEIISAVVGSSFFALPYIALATPLVPALAIGAGAFVASELVLSSYKPKETLKTTNVSLYTKLNKAKKDNKKILELIPKIENMDTRGNLNEINDTVNKIIKEVEKRPKKADNIKNFFDYYLPVLVKITDRYDEIENQRLVSSEGKNFIVKADTMISNTKDAFNTILASLYEKDIMDIDADMKIFDMMLKAEGITNDNSIMKQVKKGVKHEK